MTENSSVHYHIIQYLLTINELWFIRLKFLEVNPFIHINLICA